MTEKERKLKSDLVKLKEIFSSQDDIVLPKSLYSQNLIHLLPEKPEKKSFNLLEFLVSKKLVPVYTTVVAALLLLAIIPRVALNAENFGMKSEQAGIEEFAEKDTVEPEMEMAMAMDAAPPAGEQPTVQDETIEAAGGEDLSSYFSGDEPVITEAGESAAGIIEENRGDPPAETQDNQLSSGGSNESSQRGLADPVSDNKESQTPSLEAETVAAGAQNSPRTAFGGGGSSFLIDGDWQGHSFLWQSADPQNLDQQNYKIMLRVIDNKTQKLYLEQGFKNLSSISKIAVNEDTVYIVGLDGRIPLIEVFTGISSGSLISQNTYTLQGDFYNVFTKDNFLYILTIGENIDTAGADEIIKVEESAESRTAIFSTIELATGKLTKTYIVGSGENLSIGDVSVIFNYQNDSGETESLEAVYDKGITINNSDT